MNYDDEILAFSKDELQRFLGVLYHRFRFELKVDRSLPVGSFHFGTGVADPIILRGSDAAAVLNCVHTWLEKVGWRFEITGPVQLKAPDAGLIESVIPEEVRPLVARRGIRQHINFPMDVSSYGIVEACGRGVRPQPRAPALQPHHFPQLPQPVDRRSPEL